MSLFGITWSPEVMTSARRRRFFWRKQVMWSDSASTCGRADLEPLVCDVAFDPLAADSELSSIELEVRKFGLPLSFFPGSDAMERWLDVASPWWWTTSGGGCVPLRLRDRESLSRETTPLPFTVSTLSDSAIGPRSDFRRTSPQIFDSFPSATHGFIDDVSAGSDVVELVADSGEWNPNLAAGACPWLVESRTPADGVFDVVDIGSTLPWRFWSRQSVKGPLLALFPCLLLLWWRLTGLPPSMWTQSTSVGGLGPWTTLEALPGRWLREQLDSIYTRNNRQHTCIQQSTLWHCSFIYTHSPCGG